MTKPKIFVGTMYSGENEFEQSIQSLNEQQDIEFEHYVIKNKREREAHAELYTKWNEVKDGFDCFVQLDPDTILHNSMTLKSMYDLLVYAHSNSNYMRQQHTSVQVALHDYLTNTQIYGLNMYSTDVIFHVPSDEIYCDRSTSNNKTWVQQMNMTGSISLAGWHSPDPSYEQAFHFGLHRGLKNKTQQREQCDKAYKENGDDRRMMAIIGFDVSNNFRNNPKTSYTDPEFKKAFEEAKINLQRITKKDV